MSDFILASASPRRVALLRQVDLRFIQRPADIDESRTSGEKPRDYVLRMAIAKAEKVADLAQSEFVSDNNGKGRMDHPIPVLGADTAVILADQIFGKPKKQSEAIDTLQALSGHRHQVLSAVAVCGTPVNGEPRTQTVLSETWVEFKVISRAQCEQYWLTGEPEDKAGAYAIQGIGAVFVTSIEGSYSGVVGLPLCESVELLANYGVSCWNAG